MINYLFSLGDSYGSITPSHQVAYAGSSVQIICNSMKPLRWTKDGKELREDGLTVIQNNELLLINVAETHSGNYTCHGTGLKRSETQTSTEILVGSMSYINAVFKDVVLVDDFCPRMHIGQTLQ